MTRNLCHLHHKTHTKSVALITTITEQLQGKLGGSGLFHMIFVDLYSSSSRLHVVFEAVFLVNKVQLLSSAGRGRSGLDTLHSGVLVVSAVVDTESGVRAAEDGRLCADASQIVQPDPTRPCRRGEGGGGALINPD